MLGLTPAQTDVAVLVVQGYTQCEIAQVLGIHQAAVSYRLSRANARLAARGLPPVKRPRRHARVRHMEQIAA